jgi:DnaK suppressor protein
MEVALCREMQEHKHEALVLPPCPDPNDRATGVQLSDESFHLHEKRPTDMLRKVREAQRRINERTYGFCECGVWIGKRRLEAQPTATLCIDCKTLEEEVKERQYRRRGGFALA